MNFYRQLHINYHQLDYSAWYLVVGQHARIFLAGNSSQGLIPVLGPVLRTRIKDLYYESFSFHKKIRPVFIVKSEFPGYNVLYREINNSVLRCALPLCLCLFVFYLLDGVDNGISYMIW